jgi:hypothetical protein
MPTYYTTRDLARDLGQSVHTARRVLREARIKHIRGEWWRFDLNREPERIQVEEVKARCLGGATSERRYGRKRIRQKSLNPLQPHLV